MVQDHYLLIKSLHIIRMVAWMAGLFYLPRLYAYHADVAKDSDQDALFQLMERRLLKVITTPAMIATFFFGGMMLTIPGALSGGWIHAKLGLVLILSGFHGACAAWRKSFVGGYNTKSSKFYRMINEVPTVLLIGIVLLAIMKPF